MFNHRRQSRDRVMLAKLLELVGENRLWVRQYTAGLFGDSLPENIMVSEDFLGYAEKNDFCFVEDDALAPVADRIETVYVFRWNRVYPFDRRLDLNLTHWNFRLMDGFTGSSHDRITLERYER